MYWKVEKELVKYETLILVSQVSMWSKIAAIIAFPDV